jgi:hypothetical protein
VPALSAIPASVYGYAATFAYLLQTPNALTIDNLMSATMANAFLLIAVSMALGAFFGMASAKMAAALTVKARTPVHARV